MPNPTPRLLHVDSSIRREGSRSRALAAHYVAAWRTANPDGEVVHRDLAVDPVPHFDAVVYGANLVGPAERTEDQRRARALTETLAREVLAADTILVGMALYNYGVPSTVKAWIDRLVVPGLTLDAGGTVGRLGGRRLVLALAAGGSYGPGTPREGWDHREPWLRHVFALLGLTDVTVAAAELTVARVSPTVIPLDLGAAEDESFAAATAVLDAHAAASVTADLASS